MSKAAMKYLIAAALAALAVAGCGSTEAGHSNASHRPLPTTTHAASPSASPVAAVASVNQRRLAYWLAGTSWDPSSLARIISGPAMRTYARFEAMYTEANAASGSPNTAETVSTIPGGYQDCGSDSNGNTACDALTGFRTDASGRITDFAVNGHPVAPRLAAGASGTGSQLAISDVMAYRMLPLGKVVVTYKARNITSHVVGNGNPAFLAVFDPSGGGQFQEDDFNSTTPGNLQPGESAIEYAVFATRTVTGQFSLRSNDGYMAVLAASTLRPLHAPTRATGTPVQTPAAAVPAARLACKILQTNNGEEFNVTTDGGNYRGVVYVSFSGPAGSGQVFPNTTVNGATPIGAWHRVPAADIGASAEPVTCTASAG
jgi:hypothetical protein